MPLASFDPKAFIENAGNAISSFVPKALSAAGNTISNLIPSETYHQDYRPSPPPKMGVIGSPSQMKLTTKVLPQAIASPVPAQPIQPVQPVQAPMATPQMQPSTGWQSRYQSIYDKTLPQKKLTKQDAQVLITSENGKEDPTFQNFNYDKNGKPLSVDTGLLQVNTPLDSPEISQLKNPEYNINKGLEILNKRNEYLGDKVLAVASYNKGAGGAILDPQEALNRARVIYKNAGVPLPDTPFTRNPTGFVRANMNKYMQLGLIKR